jgi:hypothetical protein
MEAAGAGVNLASCCMKACAEPEARLALPAKDTKDAKTIMNLPD